MKRTTLAEEAQTSIEARRVESRRGDMGLEQLLKLVRFLLELQAMIMQVLA